MVRTAGSGGPGRTTGGGAGRLTVVLLAVLTACALVAACVMGGLWLNERGRAGELRAERASAAELDGQYRDFATQVLTHLMTIRQETLPQDVDRIVGEIEGDFAQQFSPRKDSYKDVVKSTKIVADGAVTAAAVEKNEPDHADVIMAIDQSIANPKDKDKQQRQYRIRVTVNRHDDGTMKVSEVSFIP